MNRALAASVVLAAAACLPEQNFPGNEVMGTFELQAALVSSDCAQGMIPDDGFSFTGTFSRMQDGTRAWFTLGGVSSDAGFDGQVVVSQRAATRRFTGCGCGDNMKMVETLAVALVSRSQNRALDGGCPERPLDGGMPAPEADGGVLPPSSSSKGFDAIRACGELIDQVVPEAAECTCAPCTVRYLVGGDRR